MCSHAVSKPPFPTALRSAITLIMSILMIHRFHICELTYKLIYLSSPDQYSQSFQAICTYA